MAVSSLEPSNGKELRLLTLNFSRVIKNIMEILVLQNGWSGFGVSGGDQHVLDLCTRLKNHNDVTVMAPKPGISYISNRTDLGGVVTWELHDSFKATTLEGLFLLLIVYIERALRASVCVLPKRDFKLIIA